MTHMSSSGMDARVLVDSYAHSTLKRELEDTRSEALGSCPLTRLCFETHPNKETHLLL